MRPRSLKLSCLGVVCLFLNLKLARITTRISWTTLCESAVLGLLKAWIALHAMPFGAREQKIQASSPRWSRGLPGDDGDSRSENRGCCSSVFCCWQPSAFIPSGLVTIGSEPTAEVQAMDEGSEGFAEAKDAASTAAEEAVPASVYLRVSSWANLLLPGCRCKCARRFPRGVQGLHRACRYSRHRSRLIHEGEHQGCSGVYLKIGLTQKRHQRG